nr:MAG TPA: AT hook containing protein [Caudoviricetes sp.]DAV93905.1 MAG TPA: AT hook containing protein [Caudoviricetes sp.]
MYSNVTITFICIKKCCIGYKECFSRDELKSVEKRNKRGRPPKYEQK